MGYGIYTATDHNFFAGVVAAINALRFYGCLAPVAVIDTGLDVWMRNYLQDFAGVEVLDLEVLRKMIRWTDVKSEESPVMHACAYKAFAIVHYARFDSFTFIDGDFLPLCNLEVALGPAIRRGEFISSEDGENVWNEDHQHAAGVDPGRYNNINSGFFSADTHRYAPILEEWRNLMTRRHPFDLWYLDQGALNVVLDKNRVTKTMLSRRHWNQTGMNEMLARSGAIGRCRDTLVDRSTGERIYAWHGCGWHKLWHQIGIDHYRSDPSDRDRFYRECQGKSPRAVVELFRDFLFLGRYNRPLRRHEHLLE
jgi:hypothetical protein